MAIRGKLMWTLTVLFAGRVGAQALQTWRPIAALPPEAAFHGSELPYPLLLAAQLLILALMLRVSWRAHRGYLAPDPRRSRILAWCGGVYMALALTRLALGLAWAGAPPWFRAWIPDLFHPVLAGFVLCWAGCHRGRTTP